MTRSCHGLAPLHIELEPLASLIRLSIITSLQGGGVVSYGFWSGFGNCSPTGQGQMQSTHLLHVSSYTLYSAHSGIEFGRSRTGEGSSGGRKRGVV